MEESIDRLQPIEEQPIVNHVLEAGAGDEGHLGVRSSLHQGANWNGTRLSPWRWGRAGHGGRLRRGLEAS